MTLSRNRVLVVHVGSDENKELFYEMGKEFPKFTFLHANSVQDLDFPASTDVLPCVLIIHQGIQLNSFSEETYLLDTHNYLSCFELDNGEDKYLTSNEIDSLLLYNKNVVCLNGSLKFPQDDKSKLVSQRIQSLGLTFKSIDIVDIKNDELNVFSFYSNGKLVLNGYDEFEGKSDNELKELFQTPIESRLEILIHRAPVVVFMKGDKQNQKCGFSRQMILLLTDYCQIGLNGFETFDILLDEEVRSELKVFSNWPTYPQLYVKGELIGGLDICKELAKSGELAQILSS